MGEPQLQEKPKQTNVGVEIAKAAVKTSLLSTLKVPILIVLGLLLLIGLIGGMALTFTFHQPKQEEEIATGPGGWDVGEITSFGAKEIPAQFIPIYKEAAAKYGVPWNLLAAHHRVETVFSTISPMVSPVGAIGHMQFMPKTWIGWSFKGGTRAGNASIPDSILTDPAQIKKYGGYGTDGDGDGRADPMNIKDAMYSAARYLAANGAASGNIRKAILAYNHSTEYLNQVLGFAEQYVTSYVAIQTGAGAKSGKGGIVGSNGMFKSTGRWDGPASGVIWPRLSHPLISGATNIHPILMERLVKLSQAYGNKKISVSDGGRTYAQQVDVKRRKPRLAATPGRSNHEIGTAVDVAKGWLRPLRDKDLKKFGLYKSALSKNEDWHIDLIENDGRSNRETIMALGGLSPNKNK